MSCILTELQTSDDTAISSGTTPDFTAIPRRDISFGRDQASERVRITIVDDRNYEITEHFLVELSSSVSSDQLCTPSTAVITIVSDDGKTHFGHTMVAPPV